MFKLKNACFDTVISYQLSQKFKQLKNDEFNYLTIILKPLITKMSSLSFHFIIKTFVFNRQVEPRKREILTRI